MKPLLSLIVVLLLFSSCSPYQTALKREPADNNQKYTVDYLFEHDSCKVYRFYDMGHYVYFTHCPGEAVVKTDSTEIRNSTNFTVKNH